MSYPHPKYVCKYKKLSNFGEFKKIKIKNKETVCQKLTFLNNEFAKHEAL
jgi:hypothetical protein